MKYAQILREQAAALETERAALVAEVEAIAATTETETRSTTPDEDARLDEIVSRGQAIAAEIVAKLARADELDALEVERAQAPAGPQFLRKSEAPAPTDIRSLAPMQVRDAAMRVIDANVDRLDGFDAERAASMARVLTRSDQNYNGTYIGRRLLVTESPEYRSAFVKLLANPGSPAWTAEEGRAVEEFRAMSIGVDTAGGFGVPILIDPTILITTGTKASPLLGISRIETITNDVWRGVSAAAAAWSFDTEAAEVSDDAITTAQPSVTAHMARGYIPYSIEFGQDYPNAARELGAALEYGYQDLLASKLAAGSGTNEPWGIFTALDANTNAEVVVTTNAVFGAEDLDKVWAALPERWRARASWFMSVGYENSIRGFGSGTATSRFTVDQTRDGLSLLNGRGVYLSDYAPAKATTTTARNLLVVGDFSQFIVAQRAGMSVEVLPLVVGTTTNRPTGERGLFAFARIGSDSVIDTAFRMLTNT